MAENQPLNLAPNQMLFRLGEAAQYPAQLAPDGRLPLLCPLDHRDRFTGKRINECIGQRCAMFHPEGVAKVQMTEESVKKGEDAVVRQVDALIGACAVALLARIGAQTIQAKSQEWEVNMRVAQAVGVKLTRGEQGQVILPPLFPPAEPAAEPPGVEGPNHVEHHSV